MFMSLMVMRAASRRAVNSSSRADNTKNRQNKAMDILIELLDEGNLTDHPGLSIGSCCPGISSLPLRGDKGSLDGVEAERELTNLAPRVRAWIVSHIQITVGLVDFPAAMGRTPLQFRRAHVRRAGGIG